MEVSVRDPKKIGESSMSAYISFTVVASGGLLGEAPCSVERRYSDFTWLQDILKENNPGYIIPPLPEKGTQTGNLVAARGDDDFLEKRRLGLQRFLRRCVSHGAFCDAPELVQFLQASDLGSYRTSLRKNERKTSVSSWFSKTVTKLSANENVQAVAAKAGKDLTTSKSPEDLEADNEAKYVQDLTVYVKTLQQRAAGAHTGCRTSSTQLSGMAQALGALGQLEQQQGDDTGEMRVRIAPVAELMAEQEACMMADLAEQLDDYVKLLGSVRGMLNQREDKRVDAVTERNALAKLVNSGREEGRDTQQIKTDAAEEQLRLTHSRAMQEMARFRREKTADFAHIMRAWVVLQARQTTRLNDMLQSLVSQLDSNIAGEFVVSEATRGVADMSFGAGGVTPSAPPASSYPPAPPATMGEPQPGAGVGLGDTADSHVTL